MASENDVFSSAHWTSIRPQSGWHLLDFREIWAYRELLATLAIRDIKVRYKQTVLGATWAIIQPLTTMVIFTIIFGRLAQIPSEGFPYPVFVYSALLPWIFFANAISTSGNSLVGSAQLVSKVYFVLLNNEPKSVMKDNLYRWSIASFSFPSKRCSANLRLRYSNSFSCLNS